MLAAWGKEHTMALALLHGTHAHTHTHTHTHTTERERDTHTHKHTHTPTLTLDRCGPEALRQRAGKISVPALLEDSYTSSLRPHTLVA